jgi:hypothetical protein
MLLLLLLRRQQAFGGAWKQLRQQGRVGVCRER